MYNILVTVTKESDHTTHVIPVQNSHQNSLSAVLYNIKNLLDIPVHLSTVNEGDDIRLTVQKPISDDLFKLIHYILTNLTKLGDLCLFHRWQPIDENISLEHSVTYILPNDKKYLLYAHVNSVFKALREVKPKIQGKDGYDLNTIDELIDELDKVVVEVYNKINEQNESDLKPNQTIIELSPYLIRNIVSNDIIKTCTTGVQLNKLHKFTTEENFNPVIEYLEKELHHLSGINVYIFRINLNTYYVLPLENKLNLLSVIDKYLAIYKPETVEKFVSREIYIPVSDIGNVSTGMNLIDIIFNDPSFMDAFMLKLTDTLINYKE